VNRSFKSPATENLRPPVEPPVGPPDEALVEPSDGLSVEQSFKPSTSSPLPAHSSAPPTSINQSGGQPFKPFRPSAPLTSVSWPMSQSVGQSMRQRMRQLIRLAKFTRTPIHVRCDIEWIRKSLLNDTRQWLLNNRTDETVLSPF
jgi:hypothetical protein